MEENKIIVFPKTRDFSNKMNATFAFVKSNFKSMGRCMLFIAGPPVLIASLLLSSFIGDFLKLAMNAGRNPEAVTNYFLNVNFWIQIVLMSLFSLVSYVAVIATTNNYMILYAEKKSTDLDVNEVWSRVQQTLGMYLGTTLLFVLLTILLYVVMLLPIAILSSVSPILVVFGAIFMIGGLIYIMVTVSLVFPIQAFEQKNFFQAVIRSFYLIRSKWWSTFGLLFLLSLLVGVISYVFTMPAMILQGISMAHKVDDVNASTSTGDTIAFLLNALGYVCQLLLYLLPNVGLVFQYFNLVEMKEARGLMQQIESIGQEQKPLRDDEHY